MLSRVQLTTWFNFYCLVRTFSNSMEATLSAVALYYWVRACLSRRPSFRTAWWFAGAAVVVRPPMAVVVWLPLFLLRALALTRGPRAGLVNFVAEVGLCFRNRFEQKMF